KPPLPHGAISAEDSGKKGRTARPRLKAPVPPGDGAQRGVPRGGLWSEEEIASSGTGSERAKIASVAVRKPPASPWHRGHSKGGHS
ncbi:MAG: hypothetical protein WBA34_08770, partial [Candidatus Deferrimicrobiaceae bacterium]